MSLRVISVAAISVIVAMSCTGGGKQVAETSNHKSQPSIWMERYDSIGATELPDNPVQLIGNEWMLVTAGNQSSYNTMTASWGGLGYIWGRPATFIFIRNIRYTYQFLQNEESFTLSFFNEEYRGALTICGTKSGRDTDKIKEAGLTPIVTPSGLMTFGEARMVIECKKMLVQELDYGNLTEPYKHAIIQESYSKEPAAHQMFIAEITGIWLKK